MGERGKIVGIDGSMVLVQLQRTEACAKCKACTAGFATQEMTLKAINECNAEVNDWVSIELEGNNFLKAVLIMYGIPFIFMIFGFLAGSYVTVILGYMDSSEVAGFLSGIVLMGLAFLLIKSQEGKWNLKKYTPKAVEILRV